MAKIALLFDFQLFDFRLFARQKSPESLDFLDGQKVKKQKVPRLFAFWRPYRPGFAKSRGKKSPDFLLFAGRTL